MIVQSILFYLIGFAGTGKYTIAKALREKTGAIIVDNQLINAPVFTVVNADGVTSLHPGVWREIRKIREAVFNTLCYMAAPDLSFVLTNELFVQSSEHKIFDEVHSVAETRRSLFVPVRLTCERDELLSRVQSVDRKERQKETSPEALAARLDSLELLKPDHSNLLALDVTRLSPEDAANLIIEHANALRGTL